MNIGSFNLNGAAHQIAAFVPLILMVFAFIGLLMTGWALFSLTRMRGAQMGMMMQHQEGFGGILSMLIIGSFLVSLPDIASITSTSLGAGGTAAAARAALFGGNAIGATSSGNQQFQDAIRFAFTVIAVVGLIGFGRGWLMINAISRGRGGAGQSIGHASTLVIGGALAMNIPWTITLLAHSLGYSLGSTLFG